MGHLWLTGLGIYEKSHLQHEVPRRRCDNGEPEDQATCEDKGGVQNRGAREQGLPVSEHM